VKRRIVIFGWQDPAAQRAFRDLAGFPDQAETLAQVGS
jgi:hypothetical protein